MKSTPAGKNHLQPVAGWPSIEDLHVFVTVARNGGFARAALELGLSPSYISKRIATLEKRLGTRLFFRNNRIMRLTPEGEKALEGAVQIVGSVGDFVSDLNGLRGELTGNIILSCSFGFGHEYLSQALSELMLLHPGLNVKLVLSDREVDLIDEGVDIEILVGDDIKDLYIARRLAANRRILCASPDYLQRAGTPANADELGRHECLIIQERSSAYGHWALTNGRENILCRVNSRHSSNSGSVVLAWALRGHGIVLRSAWDVAKYVQSGELVQLLPEWYQEANIWAVYTQRSSSSLRIKTCIDFLSDYFAKRLPEAGVTGQAR
ncbi:LysR substrate-binding domain-containing protein [Pantoea sp. BAV 3049]|uniref:LysR substrate-binding domain-containing protein n=1 Tax=Pantoea sp. BAV 3049 TaxID=2654188 RepID=UPI00131E6546|nr:LysR substrate-binding domain-containing protein [Pantoea sp. BAV 3049]